MIKRKLLILSLFLLSISLFSSCSSSENVTDDKDNDIEINEDEEKEVIDYTNAIFASPLGNGTGSMDDPCSLLDGINRLNDTNNALYLYGGTYNFTSSNFSGISIPPQSTTSSSINLQIAPPGITYTTLALAFFPILS